MKILVVIALAGATLFAAGPIPAARQEELSRHMLAMQQLQLEAVEAQARLQEEQRKYEAFVAALQKEFRAEGCSIRIEKTWEKTWSCPPPPATKAP